MEFYNNITNTVNPPINNFMNNIIGTSRPGEPDSIVMSVLKMVLILYSSMIAPKLPVYVLEWFDYVPFKILVLFLIAWTGSRDPSLSLLIAVTFYASINALNGKKFFENFQQIQQHEQQHKQVEQLELEPEQQQEQESVEGYTEDQALPNDTFATTEEY